MDFETIKQYGKEHKIRIENLVALDANRDPFYMGRPMQMARAEWFAELWQQNSDVHHLRGLHYRIIHSRTTTYKPDGKQYLNTEKCWNYLADSSLFARYLGLVEIDAFDDRRNPPPVTYVHKSDMPEVFVTVDEYNLNFDISPPDYELEDYESDEKFLLEIWIEKSSMNHIILPLCKKYGMNFVSGVGELSLTAVNNFVKRVSDTGRPARIFYISDFDPGGESMPVAVSRKIEWLVAAKYSDLDIGLIPIALTAEQCEEYDLPRTPIKDKDTRKPGWEKRNNEGATELDALQSLYPGELKSIIEAAIEPYFDPSLESRVEDAKADVESDLEEVRHATLKKFKKEIAVIDKLTAEIKKTVGTRAKKVKALVDKTWPAIQKELDKNAPQWEMPPEPEPKGDVVYPLFDSQRSYMDQLYYYKEFQGKLEN